MGTGQDGYNYVGTRRKKSQQTTRDKNRIKTGTLCKNVRMYRKEKVYRKKKERKEKKSLRNVKDARPG